MTHTVSCFYGALDIFEDLKVCMVLIVQEVKVQLDGGST